MTLTAVAQVQFIESKNCFLHLSHFLFKKIYSLSNNGVRLTQKNEQRELYFTIYPYPCKFLADYQVGMSAKFANYLSLKKGDDVIIGPLLSVASLHKVHASPVSSDDYEILETVAGLVEASLLSQLRIVWPKQTFSIWVSPAISVALIIDELEPALRYGRLDEHTCVVIGQPQTSADTNSLVHCGKLPETSDNHENSPDTLTNQETSQSNPQVSFNCDKFDLSLELDSFYCRIVPVLKLAEEKVVHESYLTQPYLGYMMASDCPHLLQKECQPKSGQGIVFCSLEPATTSISGSSIAINIALISNDHQPRGKYPVLYLSDLAIHALGAPVGSLVLATKQSEFSTVKGLMVSPDFDFQKEDCQKIEDELVRTLTRACIRSGPIVLNSGCKYLLENSEISKSENNPQRLVTVTLRPLDLKWGVVSLITVRSISVNLDQYSKENQRDLMAPQNLADSLPTKSTSVSENFVNKLIKSSKFCLNLSRPFFAGYHHFMDNILLTGKSGSGKSYISNLFLQRISSHPYYVHVVQLPCSTLKGKRVEGVNKIVSEALTECISCQPSILFLDSLDVLCSSPASDREKTDSAFHTLRVSYKLAALIEEVQKDNLIMIIATAVSALDLSSAICCQRGSDGHNLFSSVLNIPDLNKADRQELLEIFLVEKGCEESVLDSMELSQVAASTDGFTAKDLYRLVERAVFISFQNKGSDKVSGKDIKAALDSLSADVCRSLNVSRASGPGLSSVGGLRAAKERLVEIISWPVKFQHIISQCPMKRQTGILLYGYPGTGKTLLAKAIAAETNLNFIHIKGPELMSKYIGQSEEGVRKVFEDAQAAKPSLLFFDEFESLAPRRGAEQSGVGDRVVNQLLTALDGVVPLAGVIVMAASSCPTMIDPALLRPGRIGCHIRTDLPSLEERYEILEKLCAEVETENLNLHDIASKTTHFSGADLKGLLTTAQISVIDKQLGGGSGNPAEIFKGYSEGNADRIVLRQNDLEQSLKESRPSLNTRDRLRFQRMFEEFEGVKGALPDVTKQKVTLA